jgi:hypothetical protein
LEQRAIDAARLLRAKAFFVTCASQIHLDQLFAVRRVQD